MREILMRDSVLRVDSVTELPEEMADQRAQLLANQVGSFIDVPLLAGDQLLGVLAFGTLNRTTRWPSDVGAFLRIAAEMFCNAIARRRAEDAMRVHRDSLAHVLRLGTLGKLASGLAHELNQPLSAILSYVRGCERLLANGEVRPEFHTGLRKIAEQAVRAADVIKTLRSIVRKSEGRRDWHEPNELVGAALRFIEPEIVDSGIIISASLAADLPPVQVDAIQIEQVIVNLLRNALDALAAVPAAAHREIVVATALGGANDIAITVGDSGGGIDPREAERVFDEFFTTKTEGLGLGLSISRSIVEAHGGRIRLHENSSTGATFRFTIPAMAAPPA
jgi:C4-dicarboxylate-specific signal transduction histidine kinase